MNTDFLAGMCIALACTLSGVIGAILVLADRTYHDHEPPDDDEEIPEVPESPVDVISIENPETYYARSGMDGSEAGVF